MGAIYQADGANGKHLDVYEDKVVFSTKRGVVSFLGGSSMDGEKTIYYVDCNGVQFKKAGIQVGYIQLETASNIMNRKTNNVFNENSLAFGNRSLNETMEEIVNYIKLRVDAYKRMGNAPTSAAPLSAADELRKYKELLDMGAISQADFEAKKKQLLG